MESTKIQMEKMEFGKKLNGFHRALTNRALRALRNLVGKVTRDVGGSSSPDAQS